MFCIIQTPLYNQNSTISILKSYLNFMIVEISDKKKEAPPGTSFVLV